jgi:hypothetical protein
METFLQGAEIGRIFVRDDEFLVSAVDPGRGVVGEGEGVELGAFLHFGPAERRVDDFEFAGEDLHGAAHLAVEVVADPLGRDLPDRAAEEHQDRQGQAGGHKCQAPAQRPGLGAGQATRELHVRP